MDVKKIFVILLGIGALSSIVYALTDFRPGADIDLQNWYGIKNILNITDSDGFTVYGNVSLNDSLNMLQKDVFNITNVNTTNVYASGTITDGTLTIESGSITGALDVNCTNIHATNYNLVEDDIPTLSSTWDNTMDADRLTGLDYLNNRITILLNNITGGILGINIDLGGYDVYNATNVNATNIHTTNLYATNLETNLDGTGYDIVAENINASNFYDDGTNLNDKFIDESGDTVSASSLFNWALSNLINITDLNATNVYQNGNKVLDTSTTFGGEVSGTYNNIVIDDNALDDQYFDSESDLTALLDDNYVDVSGDTMSGNLNMNNYNITGANLISATKLTGDVDKSDVEGDVNTFIDVDGDTAVANSVFDWSDSNFTNINSAWLDYIYMTNPINDGNISDTLTLGSGSSVDKGALANTGILGFDWADSEIVDDITVNSTKEINTTKGFYADGIKITKTYLTVCGDDSCDYVTDGTCDEVEINEALKDAYSDSSKPSTVFIKRGHYYMCNPIVYFFNHNSKPNLIGDGSESTLLDWSSAGGNGILLNNTNYGGGRYQPGKISGLYLYGNSSDTTASGIVDTNNGTVNTWCPNCIFENLQIVNFHNGIKVNNSGNTYAVFRDIYIYYGAVAINITNNASASLEFRHAIFDHVSTYGQSNDISWYLDRVWHSQFNDIAVNTGQFFCDDCQDNTFISIYTEEPDVTDLRISGHSNLFLNGRNWNTIEIGFERESWDNTFINFVSAPANSFINISSNARNTRFDLGDAYGDPDLTIVDNGNNTVFTGYNNEAYYFNTSKTYLESSIYGLGNSFISNGEGLVGYWAFDENTGTTAYDSSRLENDGTLKNATWTDGRFGNAINFDSSDYQYVDTTFNASKELTGDFSVSLWFKRTRTGVQEGLVTQGTPSGTVGCRIFFYTDDRFRMLCYNASDDITYPYSEPVTDTNWHFGVATFDNSTGVGKVYVDGVKGTDGNAIGGGIDWLSSRTLKIGLYRADDTINSFNGTIDEVKIFNRSLTAQEIMAEYLLGLASHDASGNYVKKASSTTQVIKGNIEIEKANPVLYIDDSGTSDSQINIQRGGSNKWGIWNDYSENDKFKIYGYGAGATALSIDNGTNLITMGGDVVFQSKCSGSCTAGTISWNTTHICVCTSTDTWKTAPLS